MHDRLRKLSLNVYCLLAVILFALARLEKTNRFDHWLDIVMGIWCLILVHGELL